MALRVFLAAAVWLVALVFVLAGPVKAAEKVYFLHLDHLTSTSLVTDETGVPTTRQAYYPYGLTRTVGDYLPTEHQYTSQIFDQEQSGLYYYKARYYNPAIARFSQADKAEGLNRYAYVGNNPVILVDPSGKQSEKYDYNAAKECLETGQGCDNKYWQQFFLEFISPLRESREWYKMTHEEKLNALMHYINRKIPYFPRLLEIWGLLEKLNQQAWSPGRQSGVRVAGSIFSEFDYEGEYKLYREQMEALVEKDVSDLREEKESETFVCYNFADLFSLLAPKAVPELKVSVVSFYPYSGLGHAWNMLYLPENPKQLLSIDPTNNLELMSAEEAFQIYPDLEFTRPQPPVGDYKVSVNPDLFDQISNDVRTRYLEWLNPSLGSLGDY